MCKPSFMADVSLCVVLEVDLPRLHGFHLSPGAAPLPLCPGPSWWGCSGQACGRPAAAVSPRPALCSGVHTWSTPTALHTGIFHFLFSVTLLNSHPPRPLHPPPPVFPSAATNTQFLQQPNPKWILKAVAARGRPHWLIQANSLFRVQPRLFKSEE